jgi:3-phosphoshikimate 1-carboxyvinyltransferase
MTEIIQPARAVGGAVMVPGDKSISHRYAMLAAIAEGESRLENYSSGADCQSTLGCVAALGAAVRREDRAVVIAGRGLRGLTPPAGDLDCGNSGSTMRMLSGILAGQRFASRLTGDASLSRRPMERIIAPLTQMGARIEAREGRFAPLVIHGGALRAIDYTTPVASAQVKSCVLLAGLYGDGETVVREPVRTRDHTELALRQFGAEVAVAGKEVRVQPQPALQGQKLLVPGDLSSATFFLVAALLFPGSSLTVAGVGLNPTRTLLLDFLTSIGAQFKILQIGETGGELVGDLQVKSAGVRGGEIAGEVTAGLIDEIPALAVLGAASEHGLTVRDAQELRVKETDRIRTICENLARMGVQVEERPDGFRVPGRQQFRAARIDSFGDHRIAMAFAVAALRADGPCEIGDAGAAAVSFPEFFSTLRQIAS